MIIKEREHMLSFYKSVGNGFLEELSNASEIPTYVSLLEHSYKMRVINIDDVSRSFRFNPIQLKYIPTLQDSIAFSEKLNFCGYRGHLVTSQLFYEKSAANLLAACIWFFLNYKIIPYSESGETLFPEYYDDLATGQKKPTGRVFDSKAHLLEAEQSRQQGRYSSVGCVKPAYWLGKYSDMPHVLSFLNKDYETIFNVLETDPECLPLILPFMTAFLHKAMDQYEGMVGTLRVHLSRLVNKEFFWIFHRDGDDFDLSDKWNRDYLMLVAKANQKYLFSLVSSVITGAVPSGSPQSIYLYKKTLKGSFRTIKESLRIEPYVFSSEEEKSRILYANYNRVNKDVDDMINEIKLQYIKDAT